MNRHLVAVVFAAMLSGCASAPVIFTPASHEQMSTEHQLVSSEALKLSSNVISHLNDQQDIIYVQNFGGGGVAVGVLLGPLGVLANVAAIQSETNADVELLHGKIAFDPQSALRAVAPNYGIELAHDSPHAVNLTPYVQVVRDDQKQLLFGTGLIITTTLNDGRPYSARYFSQTELSFSKQQVADGLDDAQQQQLQQVLQDSIAYTVELYLSDRKGEFSSTEIVRFESEFISPRIMFTQQGHLLRNDSQRLIVRSFDHVLSLPQSAVTIVK